MGKEYEVLSIDEMSRLGKMGTIEQYNRVVIWTKGGLRRTVDIEEKDFAEDKAAAILLKAAQTADAILALGG